MFTFVVWVIGLSIMGMLALVNLSIIQKTFERNWLLGLLSGVASLVGWIVLLIIIFV
jgi:hypothetical protein